MKTFIVHDYVWSVYCEAAATLGLVIKETAYKDEYETVDPTDDTFSETASGSILTDDYIVHNKRDERGLVNYFTKDAMATFALLDERLTQDALAFNLTPHIYLSILEKLQSCLYAWEIDVNVIEDPMEWVERQSFAQLQQMYQSTLSKDSSHEQ